MSDPTLQAFGLFLLLAGGVWAGANILDHLFGGRRRW